MHHLEIVSRHSGAFNLKTFLISIFSPTLARGPGAWLMGMRAYTPGSASRGKFFFSFWLRQELKVSSTKCIKRAFNLLSSSENNETVTYD